MIVAVGRGVGVYRHAADRIDDPVRLGPMTVAVEVSIHKGLRT